MSSGPDLDAIALGSNRLHAVPGRHGMQVGAIAQQVQHVAQSCLLG
jgi:hypothetical protein